MLRCSSVIMLYKPSQRHCHFLLTCSVPLLSSSTPVSHQLHHRCLVPRVSHLHIIPSLVQFDSLSGHLLFFAPVHPARLTCPPGPLLCCHCNNFWFVASVTDFLPIVANLATFPEAISPPLPQKSCSPWCHLNWFYSEFSWGSGPMYISNPQSAQRSQWQVLEAAGDAGDDVNFKNK